MKIRGTVLLILIINRLFAGGLACKNTADHDFVIFDNGKIIHQDHNPAKRYWVGHNYIAFVDYMNTLRVYHQGHAQEITIGISEITADDSLFVWYIAGTLKVWNQGEVQLINRNVSFYKVNEGTVVYYDEYNRMLNVWYNNKIARLDENPLDFPLSSLHVSNKTVAWQTPEYQFKLFFDGEILSKSIYEEHLLFTTGELFCALNNPVNQELELLKPTGFFTLESSMVKWWKSKYRQFVYLNTYDDLKIVLDSETIKIENHKPDFSIITPFGLYYDRGGYIYYNEGREEKFVVDYIPSFSYAFFRIFVYRNSSGSIQVWNNGVEYIPSVTITASIEPMTDVLVITEATKTSFWFNGQLYSL